MQDLYKQVLYFKKTLLLVFFLIILSFIVIANTEDYIDPITYSKGDLRWCKLNAECNLLSLTVDTITVYNLSVIGQVFNVTMNLVTWNITENFNVGGNLIAKNGTFNNIEITNDLNVVNNLNANRINASDIQTDLINSSRSEDSSLQLNLEFNGNANDSSQYGNDGSFEGGANALKDVLELDGVNQYVDLGQPSSFDFSGLDDLTISAWIRKNENDFMEIIGNGVDGSNGFRFLILIDGRLRFDTIGVSDQRTIGTTNINNDVWYHIVIVKDGATATLYVNGVDENAISGAHSIFTKTTRSTKIGIHSTFAGDFNGSIACVKIYNRALGLEEINRETCNAVTNIIHTNQLITNSINTTEFTNEGDNYFKGDTHVNDNSKICYGDLDDVCSQFNETDLVWTAEVGTPNYYWNGFGNYIFDGGNLILRRQAFVSFKIDSDSSDDPRFEFQLRGNTIFTTRVDNSNQDYYQLLAGSDIVYQVHPTTFLTTFPEIVTFSENVGIGNITPQHKLSVNGDIYLTGNITMGDKITFRLGAIIDNIKDGWLRITGNFQVDGGNVSFDNGKFFWDYNNDRLGIGTSSPEYTLNINKGGGGRGIAFGIDYDALNPISTLRGGNIYFTPSEQNGAGALINTNYWNSVNESRLTLQSYNNANQLVLHEGGNVGIGNTTPQHKLSVNGNTYTDGNASIGGYTHIGLDPRDISQFVTDLGDVSIGRRLVVQSGINSYAPPYGIGLMSHESDSELKNVSLGGTADLNATTQFICDTTDPFSPENDGMFLTVIDSTPSFTGATGEIKDVINASCIRISFGSAGSDVIVDATSMTYFIYPHPVAAFLDNGFISFMIGENPDAKFEIEIDNGTGFHGVYIDDISGADQHQSLTIDTDIRNFDGIVGYNNFLYSSTGTTMIRAEIQSLELDFTDVNDSHFDFIDIVVIGKGNDNDIDAFHISPNVDHIIEMGSADEITSAWSVNGSDYINITEQLADDTNDIILFENDNDFVYIGNEENFTTVSFSLERASSHNLGIEHYYCNTTGGWEELLGVVGTTNGLKISGSISFTNPSNRGKCNESIDGGSLGGTNLSFIGFKRTTNFVLIPPIENLVSIGGGSDLFILQKDLMKLNPVDTAPETCDAEMLGAIYFDISEDQMCVCNSGGWKEMDNMGDDCT